MRSSTKRAIKIGPEQTFLTMHVYIPALLEVVKIYNGNVIDIMGDGIMVFSEVVNKDSYTITHP